MTQRGVVVLLSLALMVGACGGPEAAMPTSPPPVLSSPPPSESALGDGPGPVASGVQPEGFESVVLRIVPAGASMSQAHELCVWEAATPAQRTRGLMGVTDLGGRHGMVFVYTTDHRTSFTMRNTVMPLSIAFFDADGFVMDAFEMEPCGAEPCRRYPTPEGFRLALEVPAGELARWGVGPGARALRGSECDTPSS